MDKIWQRIEIWLEENAPHVHADLAEGTSVDALNAFEDTLKISLPNDVRESYLRHNGQVSEEPFALLDGMFYLLSLEQSLSAWQELKNTIQAEGFLNTADEDEVIEVRTYWWHEQWIPIFANGDGDYWCVDLDPTDYGSRGQIIEFWHDDQHGRTLIAKNLRTLLREFAQEIENDEYFVDEDGLMPLEELDEDDFADEF